MARPANPYDKGPFKAREVPGLVIGTAILAGGIYGLTRWLTSRTRATAASVSNPDAAPQIARASSPDPRWDR